MIAYLVRRLFYGLTVLWGVVTLVFFIFNIKPGDPAQMLLGQRATPEMVAMVEKDLGLDLPVMQRYLLYLNDLSPISFHAVDNKEPHHHYDADKYGGYLVRTGANGIVLKWPHLRRSYRTKKNVSDILFEALPGTVILAVSAMSLALVFGIALGVFTALRKDSLFDRSALFLAVLGMSSPSFYTAIIISWIGGVLLHEHIPLPGLLLVGLFIGAFIGFRKKRLLAFAGWGAGIGLTLSLIGGMFGWDWLSWSLNLPGTFLEPSGSLYEVDVFTGPYLAPRNLILPMLTLGIRPLAIIIQLTRNAMLEEMNKDYVRTARAKGLSEAAIVWRHVLRNTLNPIITAVSGWFASLLAGAVFIEFIFGWQGLGLAVYNALINEDFPVVIGSVILISSIFVLINTLVDILYGWVDPRVRIQ